MCCPECRKDPLEELDDLVQYFEYLQRANTELARENEELKKQLASRPVGALTQAWAKANAEGALERSHNDGMCWCGEDHDL